MSLQPNAPHPRPTGPQHDHPTACMLGRVIGWAILAIVALVVTAVLTVLLLLGAWSIGVVL